MSATSPGKTDDPIELGALLVLLHGADEARFRDVQATFRIWRHEQRLHEAFVADAEEQKRRGASITLYASDHSDPEPVETKYTVRIWRSGERVREEHQGGWRDGYYAVADGPLWWLWDERTGAMSNQGDPSVGSGIGQELDIMLNPTPLLSCLRLSVVGSSEVAGRATVTVQAKPRPYDPRHGRRFELHEIGAGADRYELEVDRERGVFLAVTAIRDAQPFQQITTLAIRFDESIPPETFQFEPPAGEEIRDTRDRHHLQHVTLTEAQQRAPFTVLMPDRVPAGWQMRCAFFDASERPPSPAQVSLSYRSDDGHESISISQLAMADRPSHHYENMVKTEDWQKLTRDGTAVRVRPAGWGQAQAYLDRAGTFAFLVSDNLTSEQLATIAAGLRPAPQTGSI